MSESLSTHDFWLLLSLRKLASILKFRYSLPSLALKVQSFHDMEVSWDELKELATAFLKSKLDYCNAHLTLCMSLPFYRVHTNETASIFAETKEEINDPISSSPLQQQRERRRSMGRSSVP